MSTPNDGSHEENQALSSEEISEVLAEELANRRGVRLANGERKKSFKPNKKAPTDFCRYLMTIGHTIQVALGRIPDPTTEEYHVDLSVSKEFIDVLSILKEKTAGNLTKEEEGFLNALLYELRIQHVAACKKHNIDK